MSAKPSCAFPDCTRGCMSIKRRGDNSPIRLDGGDTSKRRKWCRYHYRGKGKADRLAMLEAVS